MLPFLLIFLLTTAGGKTCLRCWPELPALLDYDLKILWGASAPPTELAHSLHSFFLEDNASLTSSYLERDHLEEETAKFFNQVDEAIKKFHNNESSLLEQVHVYEGLLVERLNERSEELQQKACNESCEINATEVTECANCNTHFMSCNDPALCPAKNLKSYAWPIILSTVLLLAIAGVGYYLFHLKRKKKKEGEQREGNHLSLGNEKKSQQQLEENSYNPSLKNVFFH